MDVIDISEKEKWNHVLKGYDKRDIYYDNAYVDICRSAGQNRTVLFSFQGRHSAMCYPVIIQDVADADVFSGSIPHGKYLDMETPYGYGGPLCYGDVGQDLEAFRKELGQWCRKEGIVSQFVRFHPLLHNARQTAGFFDRTAYMHHTIVIDTTSEDLIFSNMNSKNRNMVRKAEKNGVEIRIDNGLERMDEFRHIYEQTMDAHEADSFYYFPDRYYECIKKHFLDHTVLFHALYQNEVISSAMFFYNETYMHYHLSGTLWAYRNLASMNLLLYEAARFALRQGIERLHLGGGMSENDSLYGFKKQFNRNGELDFAIGRTIFLPEQYEELLNVRKTLDKDFDCNNSRMIQYRK